MRVAVVLGTSCMRVNTSRLQAAGGGSFQYRIAPAAARPGRVRRRCPNGTRHGFSVVVPDCAAAAAVTAAETLRRSEAEGAVLERSRSQHAAHRCRRQLRPVRRAVSSEAARLSCRDLLCGCWTVPASWRVPGDWVDHRGDRDHHRGDRRPPQRRPRPPQRRPRPPQRRPRPPQRRQRRQRPPQNHSVTPTGRSSAAPVSECRWRRCSMRRPRRTAAGCDLAPIWPLSTQQRRTPSCRGGWVTYPSGSVWSTPHCQRRRLPSATSAGWTALRLTSPTGAPTSPTIRPLCRCVWWPPALDWCGWTIVS